MALFIAALIFIKEQTISFFAPFRQLYFAMYIFDDVQKFQLDFQKLLSDFKHLVRERMTFRRANKLLGP